MIARTAEFANLDYPLALGIGALLGRAGSADDNLRKLDPTLPIIVI